MNEDYLWNKIGEDKEIEKLENALKAFRQKEPAPPALPLEPASLKKNYTLSVFRLAMPAAACLALAAVGLGIWLQTSQDKIHNEPIAVISESSKESYQSDKPAGNKQNDLSGNIATPKQSIHKRKPAKEKSLVQKADVQNKIVARKSRPVNEAVKLTKEEKYAYNQLMLALSITSEKLNIVKNKVKGIEEPENIVRNKR